MNPALRRRHTLAATAAVVSAALLFGAGTAAAVDPTTLRSGCSYSNAAEKAQNIQTCTVWSESMQSNVTVKVRPSSQQAGQQEQAVYFLGGVGGDGEAGSLMSQYSTQYTLVEVQGSSKAWSSNWEDLPVDADGNTLTNASGGEYDPQWETFIGEELPAYLNDNFSVDETGNAIVGLSMSGGQAVNIALKYPEVFKVAHSISGYYQTDSVLGYVLIPYILSTREGIANGLDGMWGNPFAPGNQWAANDVTRHIIESKNNGQTIIVSAGTGILTGQAELDELMGLGGIGEVIFGSGLETLSFASTVILNGVAVVFGLPVEYNYTNGAHTWTHWNANAATEAGMVQEALKKYEVPTDTVVGASASSDAGDVVDTPAVQKVSTSKVSAVAPAEASAAPSAPTVAQAEPTVAETEPADSPTEPTSAPNEAGASPSERTSTSEPGSSPTESASAPTEAADSATSGAMTSDSALTDSSDGRSTDGESSDSASESDAPSDQESSTADDSEESSDGSDSVEGRGAAAW